MITSERATLTGMMLYLLFLFCFFIQKLSARKQDQHNTDHGRQNKIVCAKDQKTNQSASKSDQYARTVFDSIHCSTMITTNNAVIAKSIPVVSIGSTDPSSAPIAEPMIQ